MTGGLAELRSAAEVRRAARRRLADATAEHGQRSPLRQDHSHAYEVATARWVQQLLATHADGHPIVDVARAAGVAPSSVHYRLKQAATAASAAGSEAPSPLE